VYTVAAGVLIAYGPLAAIGLISTPLRLGLYICFKNYKNHFKKCKFVQNIARNAAQTNREYPHAYVNDESIVKPVKAISARQLFASMNDRRLILVCTFKNRITHTF
jgi:hypothetical protein